MGAPQVERELSLRSLSPLVLRAERSRVQFTPGLDYIPASAVRGAIAAHYLQADGEDEVFRQMFVAGKVSFPDLLPSTEKEPGRLLPATARLCKRHGWEHGASLTDALLRLKLAEDRESLEAFKDPAWEHCPERDCRDINKRDRVHHGYMTATLKPVEANKRKKRLLTGTAINRATGTAESGMLFSQEALVEDRLFKGVLRFYGDDATGLQARLEQVLYVGSRLRIGAARSRGLGLAEVQEWQDPWGGPELESRIEAFNEALKRLAEHYKKPVDGAVYFAMTLESHLILRDRTGQAVTSLSSRPDLSTLLGLNGVTLDRHVILPAVVRGWNAQQGFPRADEPSLGRGSVLLFRIDPGYEAGVYERLASIEHDGLGQRRGEGFGRVRVCDPFHYDFVLQEMEDAG